MVRASGVVLVALGIAAAPGVVVAEDGLSSEEPGGGGTRLEAAVGLMFGSHGVDDYVGDHTGGAIDLGLGRGRWHGYVEYALFHHNGDLGDASISGLMHRGSLNGRYDLKQIWFDSAGVISAWFEAGAGFELIRWEGGGSLGRPDASIGVGGEVMLGEPTNRIGIGYAIKLLFAPAPDRKDDAMGCAGPCYEASGPLGVDIGGLMVILFPFEV